MIRVVSPYRRQEPESGAHVKLGVFDWRDALAMLAASARLRARCETVALTDETTDVGAVPAFRYPSAEPHLMLWILEVSLAYLTSKDFDRDTVFVSPDTLVVGDLRRRFAGDLTVLARFHEKYRDRPILNSVQWWPVASRGKLAAFYAEALAVARGLRRGFLRWGADCEALRVLLDPIECRGTHRRAGLAVSMHPASWALQTIPDVTVAALERGLPVAVPAWPLVIDFKGLRKLWMRPYFAASGLERLCA